MLKQDEIANNLANHFCPFYNSLMVYSKYNRGYPITSRELFTRFKVNEINIRIGHGVSQYGCDAKQDLCGVVFTYFMYLIILDIIFNNVTYKIHYRNNPALHAQIFIKEFADEEFMRASQNGVFDNIDFIRTNFKGYRIIFQYYKQYSKNKYLREKPIYINKKIKDVFTQRINEGKVQIITKTKTKDDYYELVKKRFDKLSLGDIKKIITHGEHSYYNVNRLGGDVLTKSPYFTSLTGKLYTNLLYQCHYWRIKSIWKQRFMYGWLKKQYDGKYYFTLSEKRYQEFINTYKQFHTSPRRMKFHFENLTIYKIKEEAFLDDSRPYVFEIDYPEDLGYSYHFEKVSFRNPKMIKSGKAITV